MINLKASKTVWIGRVFSILPSLMLIMSGVMKLSNNPDLPKQMAAMGIPETLIVILAILELGSVLLYAIPKTSVIGAILLTGYLGGAIFTHLRVGDFNVFMPVLLGVMIWAGLYLRDSRLQSLIPLRK